MGGSDRDSARLEPGPRMGPRHAGPWTRISSARSALRRTTFALGLLLVGLLLTSTSALAAGNVQHVFERAVKGEGECAFTEPGGVAVNEATGEVYVFDRATNSVSRLSSTGACITHFQLGTKAVEKASPKSEGIAVDNSSTSPSKGDVYVVEAHKNAVYKFKPTGPSVEKIFEITEGGAGEFAEIHGVAVDATGALRIYQGKGAFNGEHNEAIETFDNAVENALVSSLPVPGTCAPRLGFAVGPNAETFYVGRQRESRAEKCEPPTVMVKLNANGETDTEPPGGPSVGAQLDNEPTSGVAADGVSGEVYFDNVARVVAFDPGGQFVQRFAEGGAGGLASGTGVAVDSATTDVYVADGGEVKIYKPSSATELPPVPEVELPDGRKWEQVSPQNKLGSSIYGITKEIGIIVASEDGNAISYVSNAPIVPAPPNNRSPEAAQNLSRRTPSAWGTEDLAPPATPTPTGYAAGSGTLYEALSSDLTSALANPQQHEQVFSNEPLLSPEATEGTPYIRDLTTPSAACEPVPSSCYQALVSPLNDRTGKAFGGLVHFMGATPDVHHAVLKSNVELTREAVELKQGTGLYEWSTGGSLQLVSVLPAGEKAGEGEEGELLRLGGPGENFGGVMRNAISTDGSRVIWSTREGKGKLYLRNTSTHETIRVDRAQGVPQPKEAAAVYQSASTDGKRIFFTDVQRLTTDASVQKGPEGPEKEAGRGFGDLYVCEVTEEGGKQACNLKDLTTEVSAPNESAAVQGVPGASDNGSYVYFVADGALAGQGGLGHCVPEQVGPPTTCNLYVRHLSGTTWEPPKLIATLSSEEHADWRVELQLGALTAVASRVSPNGEYFAFMSDRSLTGYNNVDAKSGARDQEVFLYKASSNHLLCASCNPSGARPTGVFDTEASGEGQGLVIDRSKLWEGHWLAANIPGWTSRSKETATYQSRYLSDTGRLFFNSPDGLVSTDNNAKSDVYQYEPEKEGTCTNPLGCVSLISSGTSKQESAFLDASTSGNDVFFLTAERLVPQDSDSGFDIYDARVCGSSGCIPPPGPPPPPCEGEGCKPASPSLPPLPGAPPSSLPGAGNAGTHEVLGQKTNVPPVHKPETRQQKLAKALKACKKLKKKSKRVSCERQARKKYGAPKKATHKAKKK